MNKNNLSTNQLEDQGVIDLSQALIGCKTHPLTVLDLSSNTVSTVLFELNTTI